MGICAIIYLCANNTLTGQRERTARMNYREPDFEYLREIFDALTDDQKRALLAFGELLIPKELESPDDQTAEADPKAPETGD